MVGDPLTWRRQLRQNTHILRTRGCNVQSILRAKKNHPMQKENHLNQPSIWIGRTCWFSRVYTSWKVKDWGRSETEDSSWVAIAVTSPRPVIIDHRVVPIILALARFDPAIVVTLQQIWSSNCQVKHQHLHLHINQKPSDSWNACHHASSQKN